MPRELPLLPLLLDHVPSGLRQALAQEGIPVRSRAAGPWDSRFVLFDARHGPCRLGPGQVAIDVRRLHVDGLRDPLSALVDEHARPHRWEHAGQAVVEEVSRYDKRALREELLGQLRAELEAAGGIWLRVAAYPFPYRSAINFRIDYDEHEPAHFAATLAALAPRSDCTSHFVNGAAYRLHPEALTRLRGLDVGSHAYRHHTYRTEAENLRNLQRGINVLRAAGIEPSGFVAPHGRFNRALLSAMEKLGITHSSEFGLAYDEFPFAPHGSPVLQVPIHPVCPELFLAAESADAGGEGIERAAAYFRQVAQQKYHAREPLFFYGHPTGPLGPYPDVLESLFAAADGLAGLWRVTLTEFAAWWRVRGGVQLTVRGEGDDYVVTADHGPAEYVLGIEFCRGRDVACLPLERDRLRFSPAALAYQVRPASLVARPVRMERPRSLRSHLKRILDWEQVTPVEELDARDWRTWAKRTLRRLKER